MSAVPLWILNKGYIFSGNTDRNSCPYSCAAPEGNLMIIDIDSGGMVITPEYLAPEYVVNTSIFRRRYGLGGAEDVIC